MAAKSLIISHICRRFTQKICMFIYCFQDTGEDQKELNIFMRCFARIQKIDSVICGKRPCLLYTSDAADEEDSGDLGGRRINKKKKRISKKRTKKKKNTRELQNTKKKEMTQDVL